MLALTRHEINRRIARRSFWEYRRIIHPDLIQGAWQMDLAQHLQQFYHDMIMGGRPKLAICAPPQHGKSMQIIDFAAWFAGKMPNAKTIFASFSENLGIRANMDLQRIFDDRKYLQIFGPKIGGNNVVTVSAQPRRNKDILEYVDGSGYFRNTTVMGAVTGEGLDLGIIDDPIKGRAEASSSTTRNKTWSWFTDDYFCRFSDNAGLLWIMTRWHLDDPLGRAIDQLSGLKVIKYPAIQPDGQALFPEMKPLDFLMERKKLMTLSGWEALYQQNPVPESGQMFEVENIRILDNPPECSRIIRYWDTAGTQGGGCYTAGVKLGEMGTTDRVILNAVKGQWGPSQREAAIMQTAEIDGRGTKIYIEQQGGSSGKEVAEDTVRRLRAAGFMAEADKPTGDKVLRAQLIQPTLEHGRLYMARAPWNADYLEELRLFPVGKYLDQVDATSGAFAKLNTAVNFWMA